MESARIRAATAAIATLVAIAPGAATACNGVILIAPLQGATIAAQSLATLDALLGLAVSDIARHRVTTMDDIDSWRTTKVPRDRLGCDSVGCATEMAGAVGAHYLVSGRVSQVAKRLLLTLSLIDTRDAEPTRRIGHELLDQPEEYDSAVRAAVARLLRPRGGFDFGAGTGDEPRSHRESGNPLAVSSRLSVQDIVEGVKRSAGAVLPCLKEARAHGEIGPGKYTLILDWSIAPDGTTRRGHVMGPAGLLGTTLPTCFETGMRRWRFPATERGAPVRNFPFGPFTVR